MSRCTVRRSGLIGLLESADNLIGNQNKKKASLMLAFLVEVESILR